MPHWPAATARVPSILARTGAYLNEVLAEGVQPARFEHFIFGAPRFGEDVGYGPAGLHDPPAVAAFAKRFAEAAAACRPSDLADRYTEMMPPGISLAMIDEHFFLPFKTFILDAAAARAGMLIWMS